MTDAMATTEARNPATTQLDELTTLEVLRVMNDEDRRVADAVAEVLPTIAAVVDAAAERIATGGRLIYVGAGTSGRLGVLDAAECPPTFSTPPGQVVGLLAGGEGAMFTAVEGAEDSVQLGADDLAAIGVTERDLVVGIAASGRTPYVIGALDHARAVGAATVAFSCNRGATISGHAEVAIEVDNGPEVVTGSTRLKAGTSQKMVLNMISTATMVRLGKVYGNLMVDVSPTNEKLRDRAVRIVRSATGCDEAQARAALAEAGDHAKTAIVMILCGVDADGARDRLSSSHGFVRAAVGPR
ncbi:MAG: N-acetylmuramic acid 6-phosphate etherase [Propioniciclava sp.]|uniref:N-acetylmuramic acid 6-phosphate etherase n=1 Tax=Propioniciclava sp. TaxID=2038686 RepID=UPI0039E281D0